MMLNFFGFSYYEIALIYSVLLFCSICTLWLKLKEIQHSGDALFRYQGQNILV
jgi:hypothetical protein